MLLHLVTYCNFSQHRVYLSPPQTLQDSGYPSHTEKRRSEGEMDNGDKENASPNKNKVKRQSKSSSQLTMLSRVLARPWVRAGARRHRCRT